MCTTMDLTMTKARSSEFRTPRSAEVQLRDQPISGSAICLLQLLRERVVSANIHMHEVGSTRRCYGAMHITATPPEFADSKSGGKGIFRA